LSKVGQQSENDITIAAARCLTDLRRGKSAFAESHLGRRACELRCACFDAAMHFKKYGTFYVRKIASPNCEMRDDRETERPLTELASQI
jgi:hypothetical protein